MTFIASDFADDTQFERLVLALLGTHRIDFEHAGAVYHLGDSPRGGNISVHVGVGDSLGAAAREDLRRSLQPLSFGAAYKVLDLLVEHVLRANGAGSSRLTFARKRTLVANRPTTLPAPLDGQPAIWDRLVILYDRFEQARHAVTHRRAQATSTGGLDVHDDAGSRRDTITGAEVAAFIGAVHASAELVIASSGDSRRVGLVGWYLNELRARHGLADISEARDPAAGIRLAKVDLRRINENTWRLDAGRIREVVESQPPNSVWDVECSGGERVFMARWEDVSQLAYPTDFDLDAPPAWLVPQ